MTNSFDPTSFLDLTTTEALIRRDPLPAIEYTAVISDLTADKWASRDGTKAGVKFDVKLSLDIPHEIQVSNECEATFTISDSIMLDLNEGGGIDLRKGKNNRLRQYRDATDTNQAGQPFSARTLIGKAIKLTLKHELYNGSVMEKVGMVSKL